MTFANKQPDKFIEKRCKYISCNRLFLGTKKAKYCSASCRYKDWDKKNPRTKTG